MERKDFFKAVIAFPLLTRSLASSAQTPAKRIDAKGDGVADDTEAFKKYLLDNDVIELSSQKSYVLGEVTLKGKTIRGPGKVSMKKGSNSVFILEGDHNRIENVEFISSGKGTRPETEILLGEGMGHSIITGCSFKGRIFTAISCGVNAEDDRSLGKLSVRKDLTVSQCSFSGNYAHHLYLHLLERVSLSQNVFRNSALDSIRLRQLVRIINISNNFFQDIGQSSSADSKDAIDCFWSGTDLTIHGNQFENVATHGIDLKGHSPDQNYGTSKVIVSANHFRAIGFSAILVSSGAKTSQGWKAIKNITITQNQIEGCGSKTINPNDAAIFLRHNQEMVILDGNQIFKNFNKGIMVGNYAEGAPISKNIIIKGNIISNNGRQGQVESYGIHILGGKQIIIAENIFENDSNDANPYQTKAIVVGRYKNYEAEAIIQEKNVLSGHLNDKPSP